MTVEAKDIDHAPTRHGVTLVASIARWVLGVVFLYLGINKAFHPVDFLVAIRQYHVIEHNLLLNLLAVCLPWVEIVCGTFLLAGVAVRGSAAVSLSLLLVFTTLILRRALAEYGAEAGAVPFCAIRFDCGCGSGVVLVCRKILENSALITLAILALVIPGHRWALRQELFRRRPTA